MTIILRIPSDSHSVFILPNASTRDVSSISVDNGIEWTSQLKYEASAFIEDVFPEPGTPYKKNTF